MKAPTVIFWYVHYDASGKVYAVSNIESSEYKNFPIDRELIRDFMASGRKKAEFYKIEYFYNLSKGVVEYEQEQKIVQNNIPYIVSRTTSYKNEITLEHYAKLNKWKVVLREDVKEKVQLTSNLVFFICKKDNPCILYSTIIIDNSQINADIPFKTKIEQRLNDFSVITSKRFNSYGIKEIE